MLEKKKKTANTVLDDRQIGDGSGSSTAAPLDPSVKLNIFQVLRTILPTKGGAGHPVGGSGYSQQGPVLKQTTLHHFSQSK
jgi:hypothetical protein